MALTTKKKVRASVTPLQKASLRSLSSGRKYAWLTLNYLLMVLLAIFFLFPTVFMMVSSLKASENQLLQDLSTVNAFIPYGDISLQNYSDAFHRLPFGLYMFNSALIVTCIVALGLVLNSLIAYALARIPFPGRKLIVVVIVALIVIPFIADAFSVFLFYQFFLDIPKAYEEAALVDGASRWRIYWQLVVPLSRPVFATVAIWQVLTHLGDFLWPLLVTRGDTYRPLMVGMDVFFGQSPLRWGDIMAFASMIILPVLIAFLLFQKWFLRSVATTGIIG